MAEIKPMTLILIAGVGLAGYAIYDRQKQVVFQPAPLPSPGGAGGGRGGGGRGGDNGFDFKDILLQIGLKAGPTVLDVLKGIWNKFGGGPPDLTGPGGVALPIQRPPDLPYIPPIQRPPDLPPLSPGGGGITIPLPGFDTVKF